LMEERRRVKRRHLLYFGRIYDESARKLLGYLVDITESGFMVLSDERFPVGETYPLKLEVTDDVGQRPFISFTGKSIWCEPDIEPSRYNTGFEIVEMGPGDREIILAIIEKYGFHDS